MNTRTGAVLAVAIAVIFAAVGYGVGVWSSRSGLSPSQQAATESLVEQMLTEQSSPADEAPANATPLNVLANLDAAGRAEFGALVRDYLMTNPEVIADAINELQRKQEEASRADQVAAIATNNERIFESSRQVVLGNPDGDVTLVEFFDYNCGFCRRAHADMARLIEDDPNLRMVLKEFPVLGEGSVEAARVSVAVHLTTPEKFREFHDLLIGEQGQVNGETALAAAEEVGIDPEALRAILDDADIEETIGEVYDLAGELNLTGTPSYVTSQEVVIGAVGYDALKQKIAEARAAGCETAATC